MLNWIINQTENDTTYSINVSETSEKDVQHIIEASVDKVIKLLDNNIQDDSLYLLFEWNSHEAKLNIVITDASKTQDAPESVCCVFSSLAVQFTKETEEQRLDHTESIKFFLHDYLTTCTAFLRYSLVAIFHSSTRGQTELL